MEQYDLTTLRKKFKAKFDGTSQWSINGWINFLAKKRRPKEKVPILSEP